MEDSIYYISLVKILQLNILFFILPLLHATSWGKLIFHIWRCICFYGRICFCHMILSSWLYTSPSSLLNPQECKLSDALNKVCYCLRYLCCLGILGLSASSLSSEGFSTSKGRHQMETSYVSLLSAWCLAMCLCICSCWLQEDAFLMAIGLDTDLWI